MEDGGVRSNPEDDPEHNEPECWHSLEDARQTNGDLLIKVACRFLSFKDQVDIAWLMWMRRMLKKMMRLFLRKSWRTFFWHNIAPCKRIRFKIINNMVAIL